MYKWTEGNYGAIRWDSPLINASIIWNSTREKGEPAGYKIGINGVKIKEIYTDLEEAKRVAEKYIVEECQKVINSIS